NSFGCASGSDTTTDPWIDLQDSLPYMRLIFMSNTFFSDCPLRVPFRGGLGGGGGGGDLISIGNDYDIRLISDLPTYFATFRSYVSFGDSFHSLATVIPAQISQTLKLKSLTTTGAASGKKVVCVDTTTGQ